MGGKAKMGLGDLFKKKSDSAPSGMNTSGTATTASRPASSGGMPAGTGAVSQPIDPDEFFARPERKPKKPKVEESPEIDTSSIDPNATLRAEGEAPAVNYDYSKDKNKIETDNIDPNQYLRGEGEAPAINYDFSKDNKSINTDGVDTDTLPVWENFASAAAGSSDSE